MRFFVLTAFSFLALAAACVAGTDMVDVAKVAPGVVIELRYTRADNVFKTPFYPQGSKALLHRSTAEKLAAVQADLKKQGLRLKIWDAYRPLSVQRAMWKVLPDERYVADPAKGGRHNRGAAVDVTLVDTRGRELAMPTVHDDFSPKAAADYKRLSQVVIQNRKTLQEAMVRRGFAIYASEWWHFDDADWKRYEALDVPMVGAKK